VYILQKDSKNIIEVNFALSSCQVFKGKTTHQFPHNFQTVNGPLGQLYMVGGGDYQKDEPTLYNLFEI